MNNKIVGFDLDGTLCDAGPMRGKSYFAQTEQERQEYDLALKAHYQTAKALWHPKGPFVIITGRQEKFRHETETWLVSHNIHPIALEMMSTTPTLQNMFEHKAKWCWHYNVSVYYEDDPWLVSKMREAGFVVVQIGFLVYPS